MKKLLMVTASLHVGGLEKVAVNCMLHVDPSEYQVDFLVFSDKEKGYEELVKERGGNIYKIDSPTKGYIAFYNNVKKILSEHGPYDIVHSHVFLTSGIVLMAASAVGVPVRIAHSHSIKRASDSKFSKRPYVFLMKRLLRKFATKCCACSDEAGEYLFGSRQCVVVPNYIDVDKFAYSEANRTAIRSEFQIKDTDVVFGFVGHLTSIKNPMLALDVFDNMSSPDGRLLLVGEGELLNKLKLEVEKRNLADKVIFAGLRKDVFRILSAMDVMLCTSTSEGLGIVLLEAQANGLPVVASDGAIVNCVKQLGNCSLVNHYDDVLEWSERCGDALDEGRNFSKVESLKSSIFTETRFETIVNSLYR